MFSIFYRYFETSQLINENIKYFNIMYYNNLKDLVEKEMLIVEDQGKKTNYLINSPSKLRIPKL